MAQRTGTTTAKRRGRGSKIDGPPETPFVLQYPGGWRRVPKRELQQLDVETTPAAAIRRSDGRGQVTLTVSGPLEKPVEGMREDFVAALEEKYGDTFDLVTSSIIEVPAGRAMYTSWVLREDGRVQGHLTVQVGQHSYLLDAALLAGASDVARDVGAILGSFAVGAPA